MVDRAKCSSQLPTKVAIGPSRNSAVSGPRPWCLVLIIWTFGSSSCYIRLGECESILSRPLMALSLSYGHLIHLSIIQHQGDRGWPMSISQVICSSPTEDAFWWALICLSKIFTLSMHSHMLARLPLS